MGRAWILQSNPTKKWQVFDWWRESTRDLTHWTVASVNSKIAPGDDFALWVSGDQAGVYAIGKIAGPVTVGPVSDIDYWIDPPEGQIPGVDLDTERYFFDAPISRQALKADPTFATSLIIRMPNAGNPVPLTDIEWDALMRHVGTSGSPRRAVADGPLLQTRPISPVSERHEVVNPTGTGYRSYPEAQLVQDYGRFLGRELTRTTIQFDNGTVLRMDAFDAATNTLIEAKGAASRNNVRMAIGQLYDYRRFIKPEPNLAVLLPELPSVDMTDLLRDLSIGLIVLDGNGFTSP